MEDTVDPTEYQKQVTYGAILGDGRLERPKQGNSRLQIRHSIRQEPYVVYKHEILKPLSLNQVGFNTVRHNYFTKLYHQFYRGGVKRIPEQLLSEMNEVALAILLGDDGTYDSSSNTVKISVDRYTYEDRELLRHWLKTSFKIDASVQKDRIYILRSSFLTLIRIVSNHLPRFMHYKLGLRPPP